MNLPPLNEGNAPPGTPLKSYDITYGAEQVEQFLARTGEPAVAYVVDGTPRVPPGMLLGTYGRLIHETFFYQTGVHVSSDMQVERLPAVGEPLTVSGAISNLYERNGSKYVAFTIAVSDRSNQPVASIEHVSIYQLAKRG